MEAEVTVKFGIPESDLQGYEREKDELVRRLVDAGLYAQAGIVEWADRNFKRALEEFAEDPLTALRIATLPFEKLAVARYASVKELPPLGENTTKILVLFDRLHAFILNAVTAIVGKLIGSNH
jgi:hypothetical protein